MGYNKGYVDGYCEQGDSLLNEVRTLRNFYDSLVIDYMNNYYDNGKDRISNR